jgi:competence protein ComEA
VNLNTASASELAGLPGIGPALARAIIEQRPFDRPEELRKVKGIGDKLYERLKDQISVGEPASPKGRGG